MTILITILSILLVAVILSLFWPLLRGVRDPLIYFISGGGARQASADLLIRRRVLLENLRDIQIERDFGKLTPPEYQNLAAPLLQELEEVETRLKAAGRAVHKDQVRRNRLGWLCPDCGNLNRKEYSEDQCLQCGRSINVLFVLFGGLLLFALSHGVFVNDLAAQTPGASTVELYGVIQNGTRGNAPAVAERIELISLGEGTMQIVEVLENAGPRFRFRAIPQPRGPHLIRAVFRGENYSTMVPPAPRFYLAEQTLTVFEPGADRRNVQITGAMRVTKTRTGLAIQQFMVIANESTPPRSFQPSDYWMYIPANATAVRANLQHESTQMPIPVSLEPVEGAEQRFRLARGIRPGNSQLVIDYELPALQFRDALALDRSTPELPPARGNGAPNPHAFRIIFWQPSNARPEVSGGQAESIQVPNLGEALRVVYPTPTAEDTESSTVRFDFSGGGVFIENPLESDTNPLFDTPLQTIVGVISGLIVFFLLASVLAGSGLRLVPRSDSAKKNTKNQAASS